MLLQFVKHLLISLLTLIVILDISSDEADIFYSIQKAEDLYSEGKTQEAIEIYLNIIDKITQKSLKNSVLFNLARCYSQIRDDDSAIRTYLRIVSEDPNSYDASNAVSLLMNIYVQRYQFDEMVAIQNQIVQRFPGTESAAMAIYRIASYLYSRGDYASAIERYEEIMNNYPSTTIKQNTVNRLVYMYIDMGLLDKAKKLVEGLLESDPNNYHMLGQLALIYRKQKDYDKALDIYQKMKNLQQNDIDIHEQIGELFFEKGEIDKALKEWYKITDFMQNQYTRHQVLAGILKSHGIYDKAIEEYRKAISLQPGVYYVYKQLAEIYVINNRVNEAIDVYLDLLLNSRQNYYEKAEIVKDILDICKLYNVSDKFISKLNEGVERYPNNVNLITTLSELYFDKGEFDLCLELLKRASLLTRDNGAMIFQKAGILEREHRHETSIKYYELISKLFPDSDIALQAAINMARIEKESGDHQKALSLLQNVISKVKDEGSTNIKVLALVSMGDIYLQKMRNVPEALSLYLKAKNLLETSSNPIEVAKESPNVYLKIAKSYMLMGHYEEVEKTVDMIPLKYQSSAVKAQIAKFLGDYYLAKGDFEKAKAKYELATNSELDEPWVNDALEKIAIIGDFLGHGLEDYLLLYAKAETFKELGQYDQALASLSEIVNSQMKGEPIDRAKLNLGEILQLKSNFFGAMGIYEELVSLKSRFAPEALFRIAEIYWRNIGDKRRAIEAFRKLINDYPDSILIPDARKNLQAIANIDKDMDMKVP